PMRIVLVTSRQTAALQDMLKVLKRYPFLHVSVFHVPVQGDGASVEIAGALAALSREAARGRGVDVIVLARGGGSLVDFWQFNEEIVARAIAKSTIPIVTGIGHEVDVSISDLVADYHAHTPTEAAQVIVAQWRNARDAVETIAIRSGRALRQLLADARQRLSAIERHEVFRRPLDRINQLRQFLDDRQRSLTFAVTNRLQAAGARLNRVTSRFTECHPKYRVQLHSQRLNELQTRLRSAMSRAQERNLARVMAMDAQLRALSPEAVLKRGYS